MDTKQAKREYHRKWREKNRKHRNTYQRQYYKDNKDKFKQYQERFFNKKAKEQEQ